jgi:hypothetical protein
MTRNMGNTDRIIRTVAGVGLLALALTGVTAWGWLGVPLLATAAMGYCPPYALLGMNTCGVKKQD